MNCITAFAQILESINKDVPLMMDFIQFGGLDLITKAATVHARDNYLAMQLPKLARIILGK